MKRALVLAIALLSFASPAAAQEGHASLLDPTIAPVEPAVARYPARITERPLTLPHGWGRAGHGFVVRTGGGTFSRTLFVPTWPAYASLGVLDDLELGLVWPVPYDPTFYVLGRFVSDPLIDFGGSISVAVPAITTGNTVIRYGLPLLLRPIEWMRIDTGLYVELLFAPTISPLGLVPLTVTFAPDPAFFFGVQGSAGWIDGQRVEGDTSGFIGWTAYTPTGPVMDGRIAVQVFLPYVNVSVALSLQFYPRFWN